MNYIGFGGEIMSNEEFLAKYDNGEKFTEEELSYLRWEFVEVDTQYGEKHRWNRPATTIFRVEDRLFALDWWEGLTEMQEHEFYDQPYEVKAVKKMIEVTKYERI